LVFGTAEHAPVVWLHVPVLQASVSLLQSTGVPGLQFNVGLHVSVPLQALPSSQSALLVQEHAFLSATHPPALSLQLSTVHAIPSLHTTGAPPQTPLVQTSVFVQKSPSLHAVPSVFGGLEHVPFFGSHVPAEWHWSWGAQTTGFAPLQAPAWHVSDWVQALLSSHVVPSVIAGFEHWPVAGSQAPAAWH
jgi:hypothetical protein